MYVLHPQIPVALTVHQRSLFLQQMATITESHSWSECRGQLSIGLIHSQHSDAYTRGSGDILEGVRERRGPGYMLENVFFGYDKETTPTESQQYGCFNKTSTNVTTSCQSSTDGVDL